MLRLLLLTIDVSSVLEGLGSRAETYRFLNASLQRDLSTCIDEISVRRHDLSDLPVALTHQDFSPFNYLIDESSGRVAAVLDWDGAVYQTIGSNLNFVDTFFGNMTKEGRWEENEDSEESEAVSYERVLGNSAAQGFEGVTRERLEVSKAVGMLDYYLKRMARLKDDRTEQDLKGCLERSTFMRGCMESR